MNIYLQSIIFYRVGLWLVVVAQVYAWIPNSGVHWGAILLSLFPAMAELGTARPDPPAYFISELLGGHIRQSSIHHPKLLHGRLFTGT